MSTGGRQTYGALGLAAGVVLLGLLAPAADGAGDRRARLLQLDPGSRLGANTQVATEAGVRLVGVPGRTNFMVGLGPGQRLEGGAEHDQLGVRGVDGLIFGAAGADLIHGGGRRDLLHGGAGRDLIYGRAGRDLIHGGPGRDLIYGGPGRDRLRGGGGRDRLVDGRGATTARAGRGGDRVDVADGRGDDRVLCAAGSIVRLAADRSDRIGPGCSGRIVRVASRRPKAAPAARVAQQPVSGDGSDDNPFIAPCDNPSLVDCTVGSFPTRPPGGFGGFWSSEYVPSYKCPPDHPWLLNRDYAPYGTSIPRGVEIQGLGPIGVSISVIHRSASPPPSQVTGTRTGFLASSATNWNGPGASYKVILHCSSDYNHGHG
jgi:hypothetical protein